MLVSVIKINVYRFRKITTLYYRPIDGGNPRKTRIQWKSDDNLEISVVLLILIHQVEFTNLHQNSTAVHNDREW